MEKEIERFEAESDDGTIYTVVIIQEYRDASSMSNPNSWVPGLKRLELLDGSAVNSLDSKTFKVVATDEIIRKIG